MQPPANRWFPLGPAAAGPRVHFPEISTPFAGTNRIRFEGLRKTALSAPHLRGPKDLMRDGAPLSYVCGSTLHTRPDPVTGRRVP